MTNDKTVDKPKKIGYNTSMRKQLSKYFSEIGRKGGSSRSERKTHAAMENGKKGGRPRSQKEKFD